MSYIKQFWEFLKKDTWQSWIVSIILIVVIIKFIFFPVLSLVTGTALPMVVVESCSMYHEANFDSWWERNSGYYENIGIEKSDFESFKLKNGLNKGDIVFVTGSDSYQIGDIIIFNAGAKYPLIHRIIGSSPTETKGDHNSGQLSIEKDIQGEEIVGRAAAKIPLLGWVKLVFFEPFKPESQRGLCS